MSRRLGKRAEGDTGYGSEFATKVSGEAMRLFPMRGLAFHWS